MTFPLMSLGAIGKSLEGFNEEIRVGIDVLKKGSLEEALRGYHRLKTAYEAIDEPRKEMLAMIEGVSRATIPEMMQEREVKTVTLDVDGTNYRFTVGYRFSCSILEGKKEEGYGWLRDNGLGGIIVETVNAGTLSSAAKTRIEQEGKDLPGDLFKTGQMAYTSITKAK